jgi:hypothetical protein
VAKGRRVFSGVAILALAVGTAGQLAAQVCVGFPTAQGQGALAVTAGFPTGANDIGVEANYRMDWGLSMFGGFNAHRATGGARTTSYGAGAAFSIPELRAALPVGLFACPTVNVTLTTGSALADDVIAVPVGLGLGTIVPVGPTLTLSPYLIPEFRWSTAGGASDSNWGMSGGALLLGFLGPRIYTGVTFDRVFLQGQQAVFGVKAGWIF